MHFKNLILGLLPVLILVSCKGKPAATEAVFVNEPVELSYAHGFTIQRTNAYYRVVINNPWQLDIPLAIYYLVKSDSVSTPADGMKIKVPVESLAVSSVTQVAFLDALGETDKISGGCSPGLIYNADVQLRIANGLVADLGDAFSINVERTMLLQPSALVMSGYKQDDPYAGRVQQAGIPVVYNNEWMEETALGRAEWIKFMALLVGREDRADSLFSVISAEYTALTEKVQQQTSWASVLTGSNFRGTWYMPGGNSYMAHMLADAGGQYFFANDSTRGSLPLNVESVLTNFASADFWINCNYNSISELVAGDGKHLLFQAVKLGNVYNYNKLLLPSGANDFWESAVVRPDWLLKDLIRILHPELLPDHELKYYQQLK
jgi:iron complex transport system substrate-binding protein